MVEGRAGWPVDAVVIASIVLLNAVLGHVQEAKAIHAVAALAKMSAASAAVLRDGKLQGVPGAGLVRGDVLVLGEGDAVGAGARLIQATALRIQEAALTGESEAVLKSAQTLASPAPFGDRLDMVFKGTAVAQSTGRALVTATGMDTEMGAVAALIEATVEPPTPLETGVARIGRMLGLAVVGIAVVVVGTIFLMPEIRNASDVVMCYCWVFRWPWRRSRRVCQRLCRWCSPWACSEWLNTRRSSSTCLRSRPSVRPP